MERLRLYFYASREIAQDVASTLSLRAGPSGVICLSGDSCTTGAEAAATLSIKDRPVELRCEIEVERSAVEGPTRVHPLFGTDGLMLRPGGGSEYRYKWPILTLESAPEWKSLGIP